MSIAVGGYRSDMMYDAGQKSRKPEETFAAAGEEPAVESEITLRWSDGAVYASGTPDGQSFSVYRTEGYSREQPLLIIKGTDKEGNEFERQVNPLMVDPSNTTYAEFMALNAYLVDMGWLDSSDMPMFERPTEDNLEKADYLDALREWRDMQMDVGNMAGHYKAAKVCNALINFRDEQTGNIATIDTADGSVRAYKYEASVQSYLLGYQVLLDADGVTSRGVQVCYAPDSTAENPVVEVRITDENGKQDQVYRVNINDIDPSNATQLEMFALCSHLEKQGLSGGSRFGESYRNLLQFASYAGYDADTEAFVTEKKNWMALLSDGRAKELAEKYPVYSGWRELFLELLEEYAEKRKSNEAPDENETNSHIIEKVDGSKVLEIVSEIGGTEVTRYIEIEKGGNRAKMQECLKAYGRL